MAHASPVDAIVEPPSHHREIGVFFLMIPPGIIRCHEVHGRIHASGPAWSWHACSVLEVPRGSGSNTGTIGGFSGDKPSASWGSMWRV